MAYVDKISIAIQSGSGGDGCVSFRREKYTPKGGPDGGNGGNGGNIIFISTNKISTFLDLSNTKIYKANHGNNGSKRNQTGKKGSDCIIQVPCGTCVYDKQSNTLIQELTKNNEHYVILNGGKGGKGNQEFATSKNQAPYKATQGQPSKKQDLLLELKIIADIGLVGYPNAGKSTLLKTLTYANPKIANYPFTTLYPNLGILKQYDSELIIADIPGIIDGASKGLGLGNDFLRHISRTKTLLFLIEPNIDHIEKSIEPFLNLKKELTLYSQNLIKSKKTIIVLNKCDLISNLQIDTIVKNFKTINENITVISCYLQQGIEKLRKRIFEQC